MRNTVNILGIPIDNVSMDEALNVVKGFLSEDRVHTVTLRLGDNDGGPKGSGA